MLLLLRSSLNVFQTVYLLCIERLARGAGGCGVGVQMLCGLQHVCASAQAPTPISSPAPPAGRSWIPALC